jgi:hypothetical protein
MPTVNKHTIDIEKYLHPVVILKFAGRPRIVIAHIRECVLSKKGSNEDIPESD